MSGLGQAVAGMAKLEHASGSIIVESRGLGVRLWEGGGVRERKVALAIVIARQCKGSSSIGRLKPSLLHIQHSSKVVPDL